MSNFSAVNFEHGAWDAAFDLQQQQQQLDCGMSGLQKLHWAMQNGQLPMSAAAAAPPTTPSAAAAADTVPAAAGDDELEDFDDFLLSMMQKELDNISQHDLHTTQQ
jgi:hypothetical protein